MLSSSIIGVGFFSLPYVASRVGLPVMLGFMFFLLGFAAIEHWMFAQVAIATPDYKRFPGFARHYLGKGGEVFSYITTLLTSFWAIVAYLIVGGGFLKTLLGDFSPHSDLFYTLIYFSLGALFILLGVRIVSKISFFALLSFLAILAIISTAALPHFSLGNLLAREGSARDLLLPYGAIIFSIWGLGLIPEAEEILRQNKKDIAFIAPLALLLPFLFYLVFIVVVLGIAGKNISESALSSLQGILGPEIFSFALLLGLFSTFNAFVCMGLTLKKVLHYDMKMPQAFAWAITCFTPLALYFYGLRSFISIISFIGGIVMGIEGIMILAMYKIIRPQSRLVYAMALIFAAGIICEIFRFIG